MSCESGITVSRSSTVSLLAKVDLTQQALRARRKALVDLIDDLRRFVPGAWPALQSSLAEDVSMIDERMAKMGARP